DDLRFQMPDVVPGDRLLRVARLRIDRDPGLPGEVLGFLLQEGLDLGLRLVDEVRHALSERADQVSGKRVPRIRHNDLLRRERITETEHEDPPPRTYLALCWASFTSFRRPDAVPCRIFFVS